jgi:hypothetical protein
MEHPNQTSNSPYYRNPDRLQKICLVGSYTKPDHDLGKLSAYPVPNYPLIRVGRVAPTVTLELHSQIWC